MPAEDCAVRRASQRDERKGERKTPLRSFALDSTLLGTGNEGFIFSNLRD